MIKKREKIKNVVYLLTILLLNLRDKVVGFIVSQHSVGAIATPSE